MSEGLNTRLDLHCFVDTASVDWQPSPSPGVCRKRLYLDGPTEAGRVTSVVRYDPGSAFPEHAHPEGEEYFVLSGVFSDEDGDFPEGSFVVNPDGSTHSPASRDGCEIIVRLRQNPGERKTVQVDTSKLAWSPTDVDGLAEKLLYSEPDCPARVRLLCWSAGGPKAQCKYRGVAELFVLEGELTDESGSYGPRTWLRLPA